MANTTCSSTCDSLTVTVYTNTSTGYVQHKATFARPKPNSASEAFNVAFKLLLAIHKQPMEIKSNDNSKICVVDDKLIVEDTHSITTCSFNDIFLPQLKNIYMGACTQFMNTEEYKLCMKPKSIEHVQKCMNKLVRKYIDDNTITDGAYALLYF